MKLIKKNITLLICFIITSSCQAQFKINEPDNSSSHATTHSDFVSVIASNNNINVKNGPQGITRNFIEDITKVIF